MYQGERNKKNGILVENTETYEQTLIECDTILLALGVEEDHALFDEIKSSFPQARLIGDATCPKGTVTRTLEALTLVSEPLWRCKGWEVCIDWRLGELTRQMLNKDRRSSGKLV